MVLIAVLFYVRLVDMETSSQQPLNIPQSLELKVAETMAVKRGMTHVAVEWRLKQIWI